MTGVDTSVLELIRKTLYGGPSGGVLDFNTIFSPASGNSNISDLSRSIFSGSLVGGDPATNASAESTPESSAVGNAIGAIAANAIAAAIGLPGLTSAINAVTNNAISVPNAISAVNQTISDTSQQNAIDAAVSEANAAAASQSDSNPDANGSVGDSSGDTGNTGDSASSGDSGGSSGGDSTSGDAGYANGGFVPGHDITGADSQTIQVSGGEAIIPTRIVDMLGRNFFEKILLTKSPLEIEVQKGSGK